MLDFCSRGAILKKKGICGRGERMERLPSLQQWENGPKIVAIGGGTGLSTMLRGLKNYTKNLTAIVAVSDDGGGSGVLRRDMGILPPGDIRHCMEALADTEKVMEQLLCYRFETGSLKGQSFGNLFLAALNGITGSFEDAVRSMGKVLAIKGNVVPVTTADVKLMATFENGTSVVGESIICDFKKQQDCRITHVSLIPEKPKALPAAVAAIAEADFILLGPGSLYTSIIPNLLVDGIVDAICQSRAPKCYVLNIMTQEGETEGYTASDHVDAILSHGAPGMVDLCLCSSTDISPELRARYESEGAEPLTLDIEKITARGIEVVQRSVASEEGSLARHDPDKLAAAILEIYNDRAVRLYGGGRRYER